MKAKLITFVRGLRNGTPPRFQSYLKSLTLLLVMLMSVNAWGASPVTGSYTFGGSSVSGWSANPQTTYCSLYYSGGKNSATTIKNTNISNIAGIDFSKVSNPSIEITVSGICNSGTNTFTVSLINSSGTVLVSGTAQSSKFGSGSNASNAKSSTVTMTPIKGVTGYQIYIGTKCCLTGTSYSLTYEEVSVTPVTSLILSEAGNETDLKSGKNVGDSYPLPSTTSASCGNKTFVGWSTVAIPTPGAKPSSNFYEPGTEVTLDADNTFYAVFADVSGGGTTSVTKDIIAEAGVSATQTLNATAYQIGDLPIQLTATKGVTNWPVINHNNTKGDDLRFYKSSSSVTFATTNSQPITRIEFKKNATTNSDLSTYFSANVGTLSSNVWTGSANSVTITYNNAGANFTEQMYIINVTYTVSNITYSNYTTTCGPSTYTLLFSELLLRYFPAINVTV